MIQGDDGRGSVGTQDTRQIKILLADDESFNLILLESMIQEMFPNAVIEQAMNGKLAFESVKAADEANAPFELIYMDINMPEMDGVDASILIK